MAIRQYIGARYVLKIYENSLDPQSADWESGVYYEPLVMVNYNNSSYISRKDVPASVGDPVSNPSYWALSGLYNGQIANLQNQINVIDGDVATLKTEVPTKALNMSSRTFLFMADSYDTLTNFTDTVGANIKCASFIKRSQAGACFVRHDSPWDQYSYYNILTNLNPLSDAEKAAITDVAIFASVNDSPTNDADLETAMTTLDTYLRSVLPKLEQIHLLSVGWAACNYNYQMKIDQNLRRYANYSQLLGWSYIDCTRVMRMCRWMNESDGYHPDATGGAKIAEACTNALLTGSCNWTGRANDFYFNMQLPASWGTPTIQRPASGQFRIAVKCDTNGILTWAPWDEDIFIDSITIPSYNSYSMTLEPTVSYRNPFPEYYKTHMIPIRNASAGSWDLAFLREISGTLTWYFVVGEASSITTQLRVLGETKVIIDNN